jgi:hypothetical protein
MGWVKAPTLEPGGLSAVARSAEEGPPDLSFVSPAFGLSLIGEPKSLEPGGLRRNLCGRTPHRFANGGLF